MDVGLGLDGAGAAGSVSGSAGGGEDLPGAGHRRRKVIAAAVLMLSLAGVVAFLLVVFQPFADAAGGCGGG